MSSSLRAEYEECRRQGRGALLLRASNAMFFTFAFWNLSLRPDPDFGLTRVFAHTPIFAVVTFGVGLVLGLLVLIKFKNRLHLMLCPFAVSGFALSAHRDPDAALIAIPAAALAMLLLVELITAAANRINRL